MSGKRCRIILGIHPGVKSYTDDITDLRLIEYINDFLKRTDIEKLTNIVFQCSYTCDQYGNSQFDNSYEKLNTFFEQIINGKKFIYTIDGFAQVNRVNADFAHDSVLKILKRIKGVFIGIGGESLLYGIAGNYTDITAYTNSSGVHKNNLINGKNCYLVDYDTFDLPQQHQPSVCVANVSRGGIRQSLCKKLDQLYIRDIIGVYCSAEAYKKDSVFLINYYIEHIETNQSIFIIHYKRIPFISLGNNCCIAYQLQQHQIRDARYPFDWVRYKSSDQLISCLEAKFHNYTNIIGQKPTTGIFPIFEHDFPESKVNCEISNSIKVNCYGISFPHDRLDETDVEKYQERITRMYSVPLVDYIIDCKISDSQILRLIKLLPNLRNLIILCDVDIQSRSQSIKHSIKIDITKISSPYLHTPDVWKKNHVNWSHIFK